MKTLLFLLLVLCTTNAVAQVYKYVDEKGRTQYSDVPVSQKAQAVRNLNANTVGSGKASA